MGKRSKSKDHASRKETASPPKEANIPPPTVVAPVKLAAPMQPGAEVQASTKPGMEGVQETAGKIEEESVVLLLKNMVGADEVDEELHEEIQQECGKYGKVENVVIYQEKQDDSEDAEVHVKIFVEFHESIEAKKAKNGLDGRFFGGRTVSALIYDQEMYDQQDFSA